ncbi:DUF5995 family protein [Patulibacter defluvii]|uniref:DUF5995 family protein n=1 Tax=Patulibacter defluvii TaxID=3095358 RepID=UPI002A757A7D|nr:DUF5995 family protein [Patulibacter sp. DM4]
MRAVPARRRARRALALALLVALVGPGAAAAAAPTLGPPALVAGAVPGDWAGLLPGRPVPFRPSASPVCRDGDPRCIEVTLATMRRRLAGLAARCDHDAVFALVYLRVTEEVRRALGAGDYRDPRWVAHQDAVFAADYYAVYDDWHAGRRARVPAAWRIAFDAADRGTVSGLGDFVLAMNAHINRDMPYMLARIGLTRPDGRSHRPDHDVFDRRLARLYRPVLDEIAARFDPSADDVDLGPVDDALARGLLSGWRAIVWRNAEALALARDPAARALVASGIERYAETQATILRGLLAVDRRAADRRDRWCAAHGDDGPAVRRGR